MKSPSILITLLVIAGLLSGCATIERAATVIDNNPVLADLITQEATILTIRKVGDPDRTAERIDSIANELLSHIDSGEWVSLDVISQLVAEELDKLNMSPAQRILADAFVAQLKLSIERRIVVGHVDASTLVSLRTTLNSVKSAVAHYQNFGTAPDTSILPELSDANYNAESPTPVVTSSAWERFVEYQFPSNTVDLSLYGYLTSKETRAWVANYNSHREQLTTPEQYALTSDNYLQEQRDANRVRFGKLRALMTATEPDTGVVDADTYEAALQLP